MSLMALECLGTFRRTDPFEAKTQSKSKDQIKIETRFRMVHLYILPAFTTEVANSQTLSLSSSKRHVVPAPFHVDGVIGMQQHMFIKLKGGEGNRKVVDTQKRW